MICQNCWEDLIKKRNHYLSDYDWHWQHLNQIICQSKERRSWFWSGCVNMEKGIKIQKMYGLCWRPVLTAIAWRNSAMLTSDPLSNVPFLRLVHMYIWSYVHITKAHLCYELNAVPFLRLFLKYIWSYVHITKACLCYVLNAVMTTCHQLKAPV